MMNVSTYTPKSITHVPENGVAAAYVKCVFLERVAYREKGREREREREDA